jgi:hypothetical protein
MDPAILDNKFARIGARLKIADRPTRRFRAPGAFSVDAQTDRKGEFFEIAQQPGADATVEVLDVQPADRHLLLLVREGKDKSKYLCGHDERHWFVAGIPDKAPIGTIKQAKEALKPTEVQTAQARQGIKGHARNRRKNSAYVRQGEWFFTPASGLVVDEKRFLRNEPFTRRNGGKPHWAEFCCRVGGATVYVSRQHPNGLREHTLSEAGPGEPGSQGLGLADHAAEPDC